MKNSILFIFVTLLLSACCDSQYSKYMGLKGHVESIKYFRYEANDKFGNIEIGSLIHCTAYIFNSNGDLTNTSYYNNSGDLDGSIENVYEDNVLSKVIINHPFSSSPLIVNLIETNGDTTIWETNNEWKTKRIQQIKNDKYLCIETEQDGIIEKEEEWYDKNGNTIEHKITEKSLNSSVAVEEVVIEGVEVAIEEVEENNVILWEKSQYKDNDVIKTEYLNEQDVSIITYLYEDYDKKGNWIKRTLYRNGKPLYIEERKIKYRN